MTERTAGTEFCVSRIFEIVQSMSGQGNSITIPCPYLDFSQVTASSIYSRRS